MTDNRDRQIVTAAVELARAVDELLSPPPSKCAVCKAEGQTCGWCVCNTRNRVRDLVRKVRALAAPDKEPENWPGVDGKPIVQDCGGHFMVQQGQRGEARAIFGTTRAEAVDAWNRVVRAMSGGVDRETRGVMEYAIGLLRAAGAEINADILSEWLATHPEPKQL